MLKSVHVLILFAACLLTGWHCAPGKPGRGLICLVGGSVCFPAGAGDGGVSNAGTGDSQILSWMNPMSLTDGISPGGQDASEAQVALDNDGNSVIVWRQLDGLIFRIYKSEYRNGAWSHPTGLTDAISPSGTHAYEPQVAMDNNGNAIILWRQVDGIDDQVFIAEYRNGSWTFPSGITDNISLDGEIVYKPRLAMDNNGNALIVWHQSDNSNNRIYVSEYRSGAWTHPSSPSDAVSAGGYSATNPRVVMDDNGNALLTWVQHDGATEQIAMSEYRSGSWTHPASETDNISPAGQTASDPQAAIDNNGNGLIIWRQYDGADFQLFLSEYRSGGWAHPANLASSISPDGTSIYSPELAMADDGSAVIVWRQSNGLYTQIFKSEYRSGAWTHPSGLTDHISLDGQNAAGPRVAMDDQGNTVIAWFQSDGIDYQLFKSEYRSGAWTLPFDFSDNVSPDGESAYQPELAINSQGNVVMVWPQFDGVVDRVFVSEYR